MYLINVILKCEKLGVDDTRILLYSDFQSFLEKAIELTEDNNIRESLRGLDDKEPVIRKKGELLTYEFSKLDDRMLIL